MDKDHDEILRIFNYRCIRCGKKTRVVHEITPRSMGKIAMNLENRVPLCSKCHDWAHSIGNKNSSKILRELREKKLKVWKIT